MTICRDILKRDDLVKPSRTLLREGELHRLRRPRTSFSAEARPHASRREAFLFSDLFVIRSADSEANRILPLASLVLITCELVRCASLQTSRTLPYEADPTDQVRAHPSVPARPRPHARDAHFHVQPPCAVVLPVSQRRSALQPAIAALGLESDGS